MPIAVSLGGGCSFDFTGFDDQVTSGGQGGTHPASTGVTTSPSSSATGETTTGASTTTSGSTSSSTDSSSSTGMRELSACNDDTDDFSDADHSNSLWDTDGVTTIEDDHGVIPLGDGDDMGQFRSKGDHNFALHECWITVDVDVSSATDPLQTHAFVAFRKDTSHIVILNIHELGAADGLIVDGGTDQPVAGIAKSRIRFREQGGMLYIETKDKTDPTWTLMGMGTSPPWLSDAHELRFGASHDSQINTSEPYYFDNINAP